MLGVIADSITFIIAIFVLKSEYKKLSKMEQNQDFKDEVVTGKIYNGPKVVITISREYGSGGRYVGKLLAEDLGVKFYDKELISLISKKTGLSSNYVEENDQKLVSAKFVDNNDDKIFIAEEKVIKNLAKKESCVIVGRCADFILKDNKNVIKVFLYSDEKSKENRVIKYYNVPSNKAHSLINKVNKERKKHYKYYTNQNWDDMNNYDLALNVDSIGIKNCVTLIENYIKSKTGR